MQRMQPVAELLDKAHDGKNNYQNSIKVMQSLCQNVELTPSHQMLQALIDNQCSYIEWAQHLSTQYSRQFRDEILSSDIQAHFTELAHQSHRRQMQIEQNQPMDFDHYLQHYGRQFRY